MATERETLTLGKARNSVTHANNTELRDEELNFATVKVYSCDQ